MRNYAGSCGVETLRILLENGATHLEGTMMTHQTANKEDEQLLIQDTLELVSMLSHPQGARVLTPLTHLRGCVIDEEASRSGLIAGALGKCGLLCKCFTSRDLALSALQSSRFDLVIVRHLNVPGQCAITFAAQLRKIPLAQETPILVLQDQLFTPEERAAAPQGVSEIVPADPQPAALRLHAIGALFRARLKAV
jgi:CheY-like chemotaxis protein